MCVNAEQALLLRVIGVATLVSRLLTKTPAIVRDLRFATTRSATPIYWIGITIKKVVLSFGIDSFKNIFPR